MADMVPIGVDRLTGEGRPVLDADVITTPNGTVLTGGKPTAGSWGVNTETLAGNKTLVDADDVVQFLNPGDDTYVVTLPVITTATPFFKVVNDAPDGSTGQLLVRSSGGSTVAVIDPAQGVDLYNDGTSTWKSSLFDYTVAVAPGAALVFQGAETSTYAFAVNGLLNDTTISTPEAQHSIPAAGQITHLFRDVTNTGVSTYTVYVNNVSVGSVTASGSGTATQEILTFNPPIDVAAGDYVDVRIDTQRGNSRVGLILTGQGGYVLKFGGNAFGANYFWHVAQAADQSSQLQTSLTQSWYQEAVVVGSVTASVVAFVTNASASPMTCDLYKNGIVSESLSITTTQKGGLLYSGTDTASTVYADGDRLAIRHTDANSFQSQLSILMTGGGVQAIHCSLGSGINGYADWFLPSWQWTGSTGLIQYNEMLAMADGIPTIGYNHQNAPSQNHSLWKNGVESETLNMQALNGTVAASTVYTRGDLIALRNPSSGTPTSGTYTLVF